MVEDLTNTFATFTYTLSTGEQVHINSGMSPKQIELIQRRYWDSYSPNFHPKKNPESKTSSKIKKRHKEKYHQHR